MTTASSEFTTCIRAIVYRNEYVSLLPYTGNLDTGEFTLAQMTNEALPTPEEARLFAERYDNAQHCRTQFMAALSLTRPDLVPAMLDMLTEAQRVAVALAQRKLTWGQASTRGQEITVASRQRLAAADREWRSNLVAAHQAELAQRQAAAGLLMQWSLQQQAIAASQRPVVTNCNRLGSSVNCTSY